MGKSDKKSKSSHKWKKNRHDERDRDPNTLNISDLLNYGLIRFPVLVNELPAIITALDSHRGVKTDDIEDEELKYYINTLMSYLPVRMVQNEGWCRVSDNSAVNSNESIKQYILSELLRLGSILEPSQLTNNQSISSRFAPARFLNMFNQYPSLIDEINPILSVLFSGDAVDIGQIENESIRDLLKSFLTSIGLRMAEDDDYEENDKRKLEFSLPNDSATALAILEYYLEIVKSFQRVSKILGNSQHRPMTKLEQVSLPKPEYAGKIEDISSEDSSDDQDESRSSSSDNSRTESKVIGPAMPSKMQLEYAANAASYDDIEDDNDFVGPSPIQASFPSISSNKPPVNVLLGLTGFDNDVMERDSKLSSEFTNKPSAGQIEREEWMLTPGERDLFSGIKEGTNRKFQTGKQAKKLAEMIQRQREEYEKSGGGDQETEAIVNEHNLKRGPSLMDQHLANHNSKKVKSDHSERLPFDRERDILSHKKLDTKQVDKLVENARKLDSRFSKGFVQKTFT